MRLAISALALLVAAPAFAAEPWTLDRSHSQITFQADHLGYSLVNGRFEAFDADILFDPEAIADTQVSVVIDAASIDTGWAARDEHVRGGDFLDVETYPEITFVSKAVEQTGENTARLIGDLTLIGETREVVWDVTLNRLAPNPFNGAPTAGFAIEGEIVRADFGMDFGGDAFAARVPVRIDVEITPAEFAATQ